MSLTKIEKYQRKLKNLVKNIPDGYKLCYDMMSCEVFVVANNTEFFDNENKNMSAIYAGGGCGVNPPGFSSTTGYNSNGVIGEGIFVNMEAVQS